MRRQLRIMLLAISCVVTMSAGMAYGQGVDSQAQRAILDQYCVGCHNAQADAGTQTGLLLDELDITRIGDNPEEWEKVVRKVRAGMMPPTGNRGAPRPDDATLEAFVVGLETELNRAAVARGPNIIPPGAHRLNRAEYANAIRDLLDLEINPAMYMPVDDSVSGFDNVASALGMSAALMEGYASAAEKISRLAMGSETETRTVAYRTTGDNSQARRLDGLAFGTRGGMMFRHYFPVDGEYEIVFQPVRANTGATTGNYLGEQLEVTLDGERLRLWEFDGVDVRRSTLTLEGDHNAVRVFVKAGMHEIGAAFLAKRYAPTTDFLRQWENTTLSSIAVNGYTFYVHVSQMQVVGPFNAIGAADSASPPQDIRLPACQRCRRAGLCRRNPDEPGEQSVPTARRC